MLEASYDYLDRVKWIKTHDPATDYMEKDLRDECIKRLALSLDMSPEDLLGYTNANHWTGRQVQLDRWRMFGYNKAELWAGSICDAYLRPALSEMGYPDVEDVVIAFDDSQVVISPDRTEDALKANAAGLIGGKAARTALGVGREGRDDRRGIRRLHGPPATRPIPARGRGSRDAAGARAFAEPGHERQPARRSASTGGEHRCLTTGITDGVGSCAGGGRTGATPVPRTRWCANPPEVRRLRRRPAALYGGFRSRG